MFFSPSPLREQAGGTGEGYHVGAQSWQHGFQLLWGALGWHGNRLRFEDWAYIKPAKEIKSNSNTITDYFLRSLCSSTWMFTYHKDGFCLFFRPHVWLVGSYRPDQGSNLGPLWWMRGTLTTGLPGTPPTRVAQPRPWMWPAATGKRGVSAWKRVSNISMLLISLEFIN